MKKVSRVVLFSMGLALAVLVGLCGAGAAPAEPAVSEAPLTASDAPLAVAGRSAECEDGHSWSGACPPVAGAWIAQLSPQKEDDKTSITAEGKDGKDEKGKDDKSKKGRPLLMTFKFVPVNAKCEEFVVNAQTVTRPPRVIKAFPEVTDLTAFVGTACQFEPDDVNFTAISYGVERTEEVDKTIFIAVLSGKIEAPQEKEWGKQQDLSASSGKHEDHRQCDGPKELRAKLTVAYFDAEQDQDSNGFPDKGEEPLICLAFEAKLKRVEVQPPCKPSKGHTPTDE